MPVEITNIPVSVVVGSATLIGRQVNVTPHMPWSGDVSAEATTYRARNAAKSRIGHLFRAVRYAHPPVGGRRFKPALDYTYPAGTYDLDKWGNVPIQTGGIENGTQGRPPNPTVGSQNWRGLETQESEDCLTLNIYRPNGTPPAGGWPVLVWVHGGGWTQNSALQPQWRGEHLAAKGLIVVTVEYRLSVFGHFWAEAWEAEADWGGPSMALTDVRSALRWVRRNIAAFSGNPANVTLGGSSAGGECTLALLEDANTASLFQRAWVSSGGGIGDRDRKGQSKTTSFWGYKPLYDRLQAAIEAAAPFARDYGNPARTLAQAIAADGYASALRTAVSPSLLLSLLNRRPDLIRGQFPDGRFVSARAADYNRYPWRGGGLTYRSSIEAARAGAYTRPLVSLAAQDESNVGSGTTTGLVRRLNVFDEAEWQAQAYVDPAWNEDQRASIAWSHSTFQYPAWRITRAMAETVSAPSWLLLWAFTGSNGSTATHSSDLPFVFGNTQWGCPKTGGVDGENEITLRAIDMSNRMMQAFANYIANGNPNTLYSRGTDFDLFASPGYFTIEQYSMANPERWNVIGRNSATTAASAPVECRYENYLPGAWLDYMGRLE